MSKSKNTTAKKTQDKKKWDTPRLEIIEEKTYDVKHDMKIYAQYGGGGTGTHSTAFRDNSHIYECN